MPGKSKLTPDQRREVLRRRKAGEPAARLAEEFGVAINYAGNLSDEVLGRKLGMPRRVVAGLLRQMGGQLRRAPYSARHGKKDAPKNRRQKKLTRPQWAEIFRRHRAGETGSALAREFGVSRQAISVRLTGAADRRRVTPMTREQLDWLQGRLMPGGARRKKAWSKNEVREMLEKKFGRRVSLRTFHSQLRWMGVAIGTSDGSIGEKLRRAKIRAQIMREDHELVAKALKEGRAGRAPRGRPPKALNKKALTPKGGG